MLLIARVRSFDLMQNKGEGDDSGWVFSPTTYSSNKTYHSLRCDSSFHVTPAAVFYLPEVFLRE
jgi:hypothetical protein